MLNPYELPEAKRCPICDEPMTLKTQYIGADYYECENPNCELNQKENEQ
jgi:hypothetical protein